MKSKYLFGIGFLALAACTTSRIPDKLRYDLHLGEAVYFKSRCPEFKKVNMEGAVFAYCMAHKIYNGKCAPDEMARQFLDGSLAASAEAKARYKAMPDKKVCSIAESKYGENGTGAKNMLAR